MIVSSSALAFEKHSAIVDNLSNHKVFSSSKPLINIKRKSNPKSTSHKSLFSTSQLPASSVMNQPFDEDPLPKKAQRKVVKLKPTHSSLTKLPLAPSIITQP
jgi:hypothetical protein